jgi:hypothetical protein
VIFNSGNSLIKRKTIVSFHSSLQDIGFAKKPNLESLY